MILSDSPGDVMTDLEDDAGYFFFQSPWKNIFLWHFMDMENDAFIVTRTIDREVLKKIQSILIAHSSSKIRIRLLLRFSETDFIEKGLDPETLRILSVLINDPSSNIEIRFASNLSTTAIILDHKKAIISTGDLSLKELIEDMSYGIMVKGKDMVGGIEVDLDELWKSAYRPKENDIDDYREKIKEKLKNQHGKVWDGSDDMPVMELDMLEIGNEIEPLGRDREEPHLDEERKIIKELLLRAKEAVEEENTTTALFYLDEGLTLDPKSRELVLEKGKILFDVNGDFDGALTCCEEVLDQDEDNRDAWYLKGQCHQEMGDLEEALYCYDQATDIDPQYYPVWISKGIILGKIKGREEDGLKCLEYALSQDPYNQVAWFNKGQILEQKLKRNDEGLMAYKSLMRVNPKHVKGNFRMALINYKKMGNIKKAKKHLDKIVEVEPDHFLAWMYKGEIADEVEKDFDDAYECYEKACEIEPDNPVNLRKEMKLLIDHKTNLLRAVELADQMLQIEPGSSLALYILGLGKMKMDCDMEEALDYFNRAIKTDPNNKMAIVGKANLLAENMGEAQSAANLLRAAIKRSGDDPDLWMELGLVYFDFLYEPKEGLKCFDKVVEIDEKDPDGWYNRGLIQSRGFEKHQEALTSLDHATDLDPDHHLAWYEKGRILHQVYNMSDDSLVCLNKALEIEPNDPETLLMMANVKAGTGKVQESISLFEKAILSDPSQLESYLQLAHMAFEEKMYKKAHETLTGALQVDPKSERIWLLKADVFREQGEMSKSLECYKRVLSVNPENQEALKRKTSVEAVIEKNNH